MPQKYTPIGPPVNELPPGAELVVNEEPEEAPARGPIGTGAEHIGLPSRTLGQRAMDVLSNPFGVLAEQLPGINRPIESPETAMGDFALNAALPMRGLAAPAKFIAREAPRTVQLVNALKGKLAEELQRSSKAVNVLGEAPTNLKELSGLQQIMSGATAPFEDFAYRIRKLPPELVDEVRRLRSMTAPPSQLSQNVKRALTYAGGYALLRKLGLFGGHGYGGHP